MNKTGRAFPYRLILLGITLIAACGLVLLLQEKDRDRPVHHSNLKVVSLTPNATEIIFALGAENDLVGVSDYCEPTGSKSSLPRCGGLINPNYERILSLHPTVLFLLGEMTSISNFAQDHDIQPVSTFIDSFRDLTREITRMGKILNRTKEAEALITRLSKQLDSIRETSRSLPHPRCLILLGREKGSFRKMTAIGGTSFLSEMLAAAGGVNIFQDQKRGYFHASPESITALDPDVIFEIHSYDPMSDQDRKNIHNEWRHSRLPHAEKLHVAVLTDTFYSIPGPRMPEIALEFQRQLRKFSESLPPQ